MKLVVSVSTVAGQLLNWEEIEVPDVTTHVKVHALDGILGDKSAEHTIPIKVALDNLKARGGKGYYAEFDTTESKWIIYNRHLPGAHGKFVHGIEAEQECDRLNGKT